VYQGRQAKNKIGGKRVSRFVNREATDVVNMENGDKVFIRQRLTAGEQADLDKNLVRMELKAGEETPAMAMGDWHRQRLEICRVFIISWDFKDDEGNPVVFEPALIDNLDAPTIDELATKIDTMQKARMEDTQKKVPRHSGK